MQRDKCRPHHPQYPPACQHQVISHRPESSGKRSWKRTAANALGSATHDAANYISRGGAACFAIGTPFSICSASRSASCPATRHNRDVDNRAVDIFRRWRVWRIFRRHGQRVPSRAPVARSASASSRRCDWCAVREVRVRRKERHINLPEQKALDAVVNGAHSGTGADDENDEAWVPCHRGWWMRGKIILGYGGRWVVVGVMG